VSARVSRLYQAHHIDCSCYYFKCPPKCGVFVAVSKLSPPTVGPGATSRPSSVASSHGRMTPSLSGRVTPSSSTGYATPYGFMSGTSSGRITPASASSRISQRTPSARTRIKTTPFSTNELISFDGRKSTGPPSPTHQQASAGSPTRVHLLATSISSSPSPSGKTPRPNVGGRSNGVGLGLPSTTPTKGYSSIAIPKGRIPSAIAMPPPMSPASAPRSAETDHSSAHSVQNGATSAEDLAINNRILQDKIANLMSGMAAPSNDLVDLGALLCLFAEWWNLLGLSKILTANASQG
jgi:CAP-Gly domain-containing linker protein 1